MSNRGMWKCECVYVCACVCARACELSQYVLDCHADGEIPGDSNAQNQGCQTLHRVWDGSIQQGMSSLRGFLLPCKAPFAPPKTPFLSFPSSSPRMVSHLSLQVCRETGRGSSS